MRPRQVMGLHPVRVIRGSSKRGDARSPDSLQRSSNHGKRNRRHPVDGRRRGHQSHPGDRADPDAVLQAGQEQRARLRHRLAAGDRGGGRHRPGGLRRRRRLLRRGAGVGAVLSGANPKNLLLIVGASVTIAQAGLSGGQTAIAFTVFAVLASLTVLVPVLAYLLLGERATRVLDQLKTWLSHNNAAVMAVLLLVFGAVLLGKGIGGLTG